MYLVKFESNIDYGMIIFSKGTNSKVHSHQTQHATKFPPLTSTLHKPRQGDDKSQPYDGQPD